MAYGEYEQDTDDERERLEQDELQRQLSVKPGGQPADYSRFTEGMTQRGESGRGVAGSAMSGAGLGATAGSILPGLGTAVGAGIGAVGGAIKGAFDRKAESAKTDYSVEDARTAIGSAYKEFNGRDAEASEIDTMIRGQGWKPGDRFVGSGGMNSVIGNLRSNAEKVKNAAPAIQDPAVAGGPAAPTAAPTTAPRPQTDTRLLEGDPRKLGDPAHIAKSPKYQFLSKVQGYGRGQENDLLNDLKTEHGQHWNGWEFDGRGNFVFKGDPATLHPAWEGVTRVDAFGSYNAGPMPSGGGQTDGGQPSLVPTDTNFYNQLQAKLAALLGGPEAFEREALLNKLTGK
jgi:hypothetical protein